MESSLINQTRIFIKKEFYSDWKNKSALMALILLILISVFIVYKIVDFTADDKIWHALFFVLIIFGVVQNITRSFLNEKKGISLYYMQIIDPKALILGKIIYQILVNLFFLGILYVTLHFLLPNQIENLGGYLVTAILFTTANCIIFTFNSAVSIGARNSALMAQVLSLPLLIPALLISISVANDILLNTVRFIPFQGWGVLFLLNIILLFTSTLLFSYVWID